MIWVGVIVGIRECVCDMGGCDCGYVIWAGVIVGMCECVCDMGGCDCGYVRVCM